MVFWIDPKMVASNYKPISNLVIDDINIKKMPSGQV